MTWRKNLYDDLSVRTWIAERYGSLYDEIKVAILKGHLIHIDEATVNLKNNEKGYVWVIASLDNLLSAHHAGNFSGFRSRAGH